MQQDYCLVLLIFFFKQLCIYLHYVQSSKVILLPVANMQLGEKSCHPGRCCGPPGPMWHPAFYGGYTPFGQHNPHAMHGGGPPCWGPSSKCFPPAPPHGWAPNQTPPFPCCGPAGQFYPSPWWNHSYASECCTLSDGSCCRSPPKYCGDDCKGARTRCARQIGKCCRQQEKKKEGEEGEEAAEPDMDETISFAD